MPQTQRLPPSRGPSPLSLFPLQPVLPATPLVLFGPGLSRGLHLQSRRLPSSCVSSPVASARLPALRAPVCLHSASSALHVYRHLRLGPTCLPLCQPPQHHQATLPCNCPGPSPRSFSILSCPLHAWEEALPALTSSTTPGLRPSEGSVLCPALQPPPGPSIPTPCYIHKAHSYLEDKVAQHSLSL